MTIVHVCDGWEPWNGAANIARYVAGEQSALGHRALTCRWASLLLLRKADEVWVHCSWKPCLWWTVCASSVLRLFGFGVFVRWMPEGSYDPVRLAYHGWKKRLAGPIERFCLRRVNAAVATCDEEAAWIRAYEPRVRRVEMTDVRRFFSLGKTVPVLSSRAPLHVLFLGRRHPLKGVEFLERAVDRVNGASGVVALRVVSDHFGAELEQDWSWCDVLGLPTLSDNFALVVAEALSRGKRVLVTDGAPSFWADEPGVTYVRGYRGSEPGRRVDLLAEALAGLGR